MSASTAETGHRIVVAGAGYAGLHVALRLTAKLRNNPAVELTLVDRYDYHQALTELPRVAAGTRAADAVRIPLQDVLAERVRFVQAEISGFDLPGRQVLTERRADRLEPGWCWRWAAGPTTSPSPAWPSAPCRCTRPAMPSEYGRRSTGRSTRPRPPPIPSGSAAWRPLWSAAAAPPGSSWPASWPRCCPRWPAATAWRPTRPAVLLVEAGPTILAGSSPQLIDNATRILSDLGVQVRTNAMVAAATEEGFRLKGGQLVEGGVFVWAGGVKAPELVVGSGLPIGHNGRVKVDQYLRVLDHPEVYVAGDLASVVDPRSGHVLPPLAQVALEEGETVARNLDAELEGQPLEAFTFHDKGFVVSVGTRRGVADIAGITSGGRLAHLLKDLIEWEYRQSVTHLRGWDPLAG